MQSFHAYIYIYNDISFPRVGGLDGCFGGKGLPIYPLQGFKSPNTSPDHQLEGSFKKRKNI